MQLNVALGNQILASYNGERWGQKLPLIFGNQSSGWTNKSVHYVITPNHWLSLISFAGRS